MTRRSFTLAHAVDLSNRLIKDNDDNADPAIELILGLTPSEGDALYLAIRSEVLKNLYAHTDDFKKHFRDYIGEEPTTAGVIMTSASTS